jgi:hypothetical protein
MNQSRMLLCFDSIEILTSNGLLPCLFISIYLAIVIFKSLTVLSVHLGLHSEHIILEIGSLMPIRHEQLPNDEPSKLYSVESTSGKWWLAHACKLASSFAVGDLIMKLRSDIVLKHDFIHAFCAQ